MKITHIDRKTGEAKVVTETLEDLWHLERILEAGDRVEARTLRTVKLGTKEEKKPVFIAINVEEVEFAKAITRLRIRGKIISGTPEEFVQTGRYHTIDVDLGAKIKITKQWKQHQINRLKQAEKEAKRPKIRIIVLDEEKALTTIVRGYGIDYGPEIYSSTSKKDENYSERETQYLAEITKEIENHEERYIVAGPGFTKDNLKKYIQKKKPELLKRIIFETCSYAERNGIDELLKKGIIERIIGEDRIENELKLVEEVITKVNKDNGLAIYGVNEVKQAVEASAADKLLVLDELLRKTKEIEDIVETAEKTGVDVVIFSKESDSGAKLKGLGGIAALLRFRIN